MWEGGEEGKDDPFHLSDVHLPLSEQKSKFALTAQGLLGEDGKPIWSVDHKEETSPSSPSLISSSPSPPIVKSASANNIASATNSAFTRPEGLRPHSTSANSSELGEEDKDRPPFSSNPRAGFKHVNPTAGRVTKRKDSTLDARAREDDSSSNWDSDSAVDSGDEEVRGLRDGNHNRSARQTSTASTTSDGSGMFWNNQMPLPTKIFHEVSVRYKLRWSWWRSFRN